jgi:Bacteriocin-protection, YdeI or OmpD-Associated/Domain of unknown function (DUF1905)
MTRAPHSPKPKRFLATIYRIWMMRHIDVPDRAARDLAKQMRGPHPARTPAKSQPKYIPVVAIVNGCSARATLVPAGGGKFRMHLNTALRKAVRVDVGDLVSVELRLDRESRELPVPADLEVLLKNHPKARRAFGAFTAANRRHFIQWFDSAKSEVARQRRLDRALDVLLERDLLRPRRSNRR